MNQETGKTVGELARLAGVSVRTLHHYDRIGLLVPAARSRAGYRLYTRTDLLKLQQILLWRSLDMPLEEIASELACSKGSPVKQLKAHRKRLLERQVELSRILATIDKTIAYHEEKTMLTDEEMYEGINSETAIQWRQEARDRWTPGLVELSERRVKAMGKEGLAQVKAEGHDIAKAFVAAMIAGPTSAAAQDACQRQWNLLSKFYDPSPEIFAGLGVIYRDDSRFAANYEPLATGLASFMADAMAEYAKRRGGRAE